VWELADGGHASGATPGVATCGYRHAAGVPTPYGSLRQGKTTSLIHASDDLAAFSSSPLVRFLMRGGEKRCGGFG
jgi:hypothetical protein